MEQLESFMSKDIWVGKPEMASYGSSNLIKLYICWDSNHNMAMSMIKIDKEDYMWLMAHIYRLPSNN